MPIILDIPETETKVVTSIVITKITNSPEEEKFDCEYIKFLEDGTKSDRGHWSLVGKVAIQLFYTELDVIIATGKTFEVASKELLYSKIAIGTVV